MKVGDAVGHYLVIAPLGRGGMGEVWLAEHPVIHRRVAVKVIPKARATRPEAKTRFLAEAKAVAGVAHPHLVPVFDYGATDGGELYFTMEHVVGRSLATLLGEGGPLPSSRALRIAAQVADALAAAHAHGVIHRDLTPSNVLLVGDDDFVRVLDFGLVRLLEGAAGPTGEGMAPGTPEYMAPEQCAGRRDLDERADVYALGCLLHEMVTGTPPFTGEPEAVMLAHVAGVLEPPGRLLPRLPPHLEAAILRALARDREARFPSMTALRDALIELGPAPPEAPTLERPRRRRRTTPIALAAMGALITVAAIAWLAPPEAPLPAAEDPQHKAIAIHTAPPGALLLVDRTPRDAGLHDGESPLESRPPGPASRRRNAPSVPSEAPLGDEEGLLPPSLP